MTHDPQKFDMQPQHLAPLLFLDVDGVLHPAVAQGEQFTCLPALEAWLRAHPAVEVVVSSSWRLEFDLDTLRQMLPGDLHSRVIGVTPDLGSGGPGHRGREVLAWLERHRARQRPWRAIDDKPDWFDPVLLDHLILCNPDQGLTERQIEQLDAWVATWGGCER
jgi:hypothetical protein